MTAEPVYVARARVGAGERARIDLPLPNLYTQNPVFMPIHVVNGRKSGPRLLITAAIHGDEINGVEIIRRVLRHTALRGLRGTLVAAPVVNVYGFIRQSRYLPDRRDLNRSFPGSDSGSLAARLAATVLNELLDGASHAIDLHTGALHRENLPQIRTSLASADGIDELARAFGTPVILDAPLRPGSLRAEAAARQIPALVFEAGEALRFDEFAVRAGLRGILGVMRHLGMIRGHVTGRNLAPDPLVARATTWVRSQVSGVLLSSTPLGAHVNEGDTIGWITDPFLAAEEPVNAPSDGLVIGRTNLPLVTEGEALYHIALVRAPETAAAMVQEYRDALDPDEDEDPLII